MSQAFGTYGLSYAQKRRLPPTQRISLRARTSTVRIFEIFLRWVRRPMQQITLKPFNIEKTSRRNIVLCFPQSMHLSIQPEMEGPSRFQKQLNTARWRISTLLEISTQTRTPPRSEQLYIRIRPISLGHRRSRFPSDSQPKGFRSACKSPDMRLANQSCARSVMPTRRQPDGTRSTRMSSCGGGFTLV